MNDVRLAGKKCLNYIGVPIMYQFNPLMWSEPICWDPRTDGH